MKSFSATAAVLLSIVACGHAAEPVCPASPTAATATASSASVVPVASAAPSTAATGTGAKPNLDPMFTEPVEVALSIVDEVNPRTSCKGVAPTVVRVQIDEKPWCEVSIKCTTTASAPSPALPCKGAKIEPGEHRFGVSIVGKPTSLMLRSMSLPAFAKVGSSMLTIGANVSVSVSEERIIIDPPTASRVGGA